MKLERLGRREGTEKKEQAAIFAGRTNNAHEEGYQELKNGIHRRIVDDMTAEQQQVLDGRHTRQEVEAVITRYVQRVVEEIPLPFRAASVRVWYRISVMRSWGLARSSHS